MRHAALGPDLCGINNRNLGTFYTDVAASLALAPLLPGDAVKVSESGIGSADTVAVLRQAGFSGFLIGESLMKAESPGKELSDMINRMKKQAGTCS